MKLTVRSAHRTRLTGTGARGDCSHPRPVRPADDLRRRPAAFPSPFPRSRGARMRAPLWLSVLVVTAAAADDPKAPDPLPADLVREWEKAKAVSGWMDTAHPFLKM